MFFIFVGIVFFIEMVIFCVVGGCFFILGVVYGMFIVNWVKILFLESFFEFWLFVMGVLFIGVVMVFLDGLVGVYSSKIEF